MDFLTVVSAIVLAIGGESSMLSNETLPFILAVEQSPDRDPHSLFPLLETPTNGGQSVHETSPYSEPPRNTSNCEADHTNEQIFVPLGTPNPPQNDSPQNPLFVPLSPNPTED